VHATQSSFFSCAAAVVCGLRQVVEVARALLLPEEGVIGAGPLEGLAWFTGTHHTIMPAHTQCSPLANDCTATCGL
jgi:hypothetical protein